MSSQAILPHLSNLCFKSSRSHLGPSLFCAFSFFLLLPHLIHLYLFSVYKGPLCCPLSMSTFIRRNPAAFTTPSSVVMTIMLLVRALRPRYRPTCSFPMHSAPHRRCYLWPVADRLSKLCSEHLRSSARTSNLCCQAIFAHSEEADSVCSHRRYPLQYGMCLDDLSNMSFHSSLPFHFTHGRSQHQLSNLRCQQSRGFESYSRRFSITLQDCSVANRVDATETSSMM